MKKLIVNSRVRVRLILASLAAAWMALVWFNLRGTRPATGEEVADVLAYLRQVAASGELARVSTEHDGSYVRFADGTWIIGWHHSMHVNDGVDDYAVVLTSSNDAYFSREHFCAPGGLGRATVEDLASVSEFLERTQDRHPWVKLGRLDR
ncbi:MAG: hypothetical protein R3E97_17065 [Candidatus Eisenbacteria bacterium]